MEQEKSIDLNALVPLMLEQLKKGHTVRFTAHGQSMLPLIKDGTPVTLVSAPDTLRAGDIPFYRRASGQYVLHRVIRVEKDGTYTMCGDNQSAPERGIRPHQILALAESMDKDGAAVSLSPTAHRAYLLRLPFRRLMLRYRGMTGKRLASGIRRRLFALGRKHT